MQQESKQSQCVFRQNRASCIEALRIFLGFGLMLKGYQFFIHRDQALEYLGKIPFDSFISAHLLIFVHIIGGFFLAIGLFTRFAALIQIPLLLGAIIFIHWPDGVFSLNQNLEFVILVLFLLIMFCIYGSGTFSVDHVLAKRFSRQQKH